MDGYGSTHSASRLRVSPTTIVGEVVGASARGVRVADRLRALSLGARVSVSSADGQSFLAEVVALDDGAALCAPLADPARAGVRCGARVVFPNIGDRGVAQGDPRALLGRGVDGFGAAIDGGPALEAVARGPRGPVAGGATPPAPLRAELGGPLDFGVKAMSVFAPARIGQRLGLFAAAGLGKSTLLASIARGADCDVVIAAMVGERGREVREFAEDGLGPDGRARSVVVAASAEAPAMMRREAAFFALDVAEAFRDQGKNVLLLMDSLTRFALAQREIGLAAGEPPTTRGHTPSVFAQLPHLAERAGPGWAAAHAPAGVVPGGAITGVFTVLVEGDDHDEPIADAARAALDGHVVLTRAVAERGRFPAIDVVSSLSRTAQTALTAHERVLANDARKVIALEAEMRDLARLGAYRAGADPAIDRALRLAPRLESLFDQPSDVHVARDEAFAALASILSDEPA
ncbi:MAG: FliI/YscN family ATPase [Parvularculaceae bacterium]